MVMGGAVFFLGGGGGGCDGSRTPLKAHLHSQHP